MSSTPSNNDVKVAPGAVICVESKLRGTITIGSMTVIHPKASIIAEKGPIIIGENNIIEEQAFIWHRNPEGLPLLENPTPFVIGANNVFEVGCVVLAKEIGDNNVLEAKCYVGPDVVLGNGCIIGAGCRITLPEKISDNTVISGSQCVRTIAADKPPENLPKELKRKIQDVKGTVEKKLPTPKEEIGDTERCRLCNWKKSCKTKTRSRHYISTE